MTAAALLDGPVEGAVVGLLAGVLYDVGLVGMDGIYPIWFMLYGLLGGLISRTALAGGFLSMVLMNAFEMLLLGVLADRSSDSDKAADGNVAKVAGILKEAGHETLVYDKVKPNPTIEGVRECAALCRSEKIAFIVGLGGGSSIDTAKAVAIMATNDGDWWDHFGELYAVRCDDRGRSVHHGGPRYGRGNAEQRDGRRNHHHFGRHGNNDKYDERPHHRVLGDGAPAADHCDRRVALFGGRGPHGGGAVRKGADRGL